MPVVLFKSSLYYLAVAAWTNALGSMLCRENKTFTWSIWQKLSILCKGKGEKEQGTGKVRKYNLEKQDKT